MRGADGTNWAGLSFERMIFCLRLRMLTGSIIVLAMSVVAAGLYIGDELRRLSEVIDTRAAARSTFQADLRSEVPD